MGREHVSPPFRGPANDRDFHASRRGLGNHCCGFSGNPGEGYRKLRIGPVLLFARDVIDVDKDICSITPSCSQALCDPIAQRNVAVHDRFEPGGDIREAFPYYSEQAPYDRVQIRCWKKAPDVDLASSGGHEARFEGRRVFPLRFILRHYPIRGQAHGEPESESEAG